MDVPFVGLKAQYDIIKKEVDDAIQNVIDDTAFISGHYASIFEMNYAEKYNIKHCISCANGTDAIYIALKALPLRHLQVFIERMIHNPRPIYRPRFFRLKIMQSFDEF